jgi:hypothetical protein
MEKEQTAVEWLLQQMDLETISKYDKQLLQAKEMEKRQLIITFCESRLFSLMLGYKYDNFRQYYNQTFKNKQ